MEKIRITILVIAISISSLKAFCQSSNLEFVENKGQWDDKVKFKGSLQSGSFFLTEKGFRVLLHNPEDLREMADLYHGIKPDPKKQKLNNPKTTTADTPSVTVHSHVYDVTFLNSNIPAAVPDKPLNSYNNYFIGTDATKWKGKCKIYQAVNYRNIYSGVDVRYYTNAGALKYDIVVSPEADVSKIALKYDGVEGLKVKNRQLVITTSVGEIKELSPYAYQVINGLKKEVDCNFKVIGNTVYFSLGNYDKRSVLVIDPTMIFSTFTGSTADNWGYTATYGSDGSFFAGGVVFQDGSFPASPGAYQTTHGGGVNEGFLDGYDIGLIKFSPDGSNRLYGTYLGGSGNEQPHSIIADDKGNLIIAGRTSSPNFPLKGGGQLGPCGSLDIILTKLSAAGDSLIGSRKIGGSAYDGTNIGPKWTPPTGEVTIRRSYGDDARSEVIIDNDGNIILVSNTQSADYITTPDAFQDTLAGQQDAVVMKMSSDLSTLLFSSYLGSEGDDALFVASIDPITKKLYVGGNTTGSNLPGSKAGVYQPLFSGGNDGFVSVLSPDLKTLEKTSYFGTTGLDMIYGLQIDRYGYPYITGTTTETWPIVNASFKQPGGKQFISKLKPDLSGFVYSTVFGTNTSQPNISPIAFLVDRCENVYVSGWGGNVNSLTGYSGAGTQGLSVTPDALQPFTDNSDFYFFVLQKNATGQLYGSFFGQQGGTGEHVDGGTSRFDKNGVIYQALCANCYPHSALFPVTPGAWSTVNPSSNCNLAAVKIAFNLSGLASSIKSSINGSFQDTVGCVPLKVVFKDTLAEGALYVWDFGDGTKKDSSTQPLLAHTFTQPGRYKITLVSIDSSKCNTADTASTFINVRTAKAVVSYRIKKLLPCDSGKYVFYNESFVSPALRSFNSHSFRWDFGDNTPPVIAGPDSVIHTFPAPGRYVVKLTLIDTAFCNAPLDTSQIVSFDFNVKARFITAPFGCAPYKAVFTNQSVAADSSYWVFGDGATSGVTTPAHVYNTPGNYTVKLYAFNEGTCNKKDSALFNIRVNVKPTAGFNFSPDPPAENTAIDFTNTSVNGDIFVWKFGDADSFVTRTYESVSHYYNRTDTFKPCLVASTLAGCSDTVCQSLRARVLPLLDVPNAFTPNGDGINDKVYVRGFGITKMRWRIYDRWGTMVFETTDKNQGWDGKFKGSLQPQEVYHYVLDVEYSDSTNFSKKGDITLLR